MNAKQHIVLVYKTIAWSANCKEMVLNPTVSDSLMTDGCRNRVLYLALLLLYIYGAFQQHYKALFAASG